MAEIPDFFPGLNFMLAPALDWILDSLQARGHACTLIESNIRQFKNSHNRPNDDQWKQYTEEYQKVVGKDFPHKRDDVYVVYQ
ncbi:hypothetical protein BFJ63_vAg17745 [Fusarium oxysporum f. sp. narcissi]|uniref:Uncharacterized protein n=1 Tax=Fusarium oxysporum f. sp. narcissi TaxID=451672 RepID=A0A4Q2V500_FUSOX|nr:hypothetical protein BFJ63_vAg17745 [Fusarium oxysporum f. sp. narcissi]